MKYLCLIYHDASKSDHLAEADVATLVRDSITYDDELRESGHLLASAPLEPPRMATTLRVRGGHLAITDGPFAESKEFMSGFVLIQARDLNEAIRVASKIPPGRIGIVEVRPI